MNRGSSAKSTIIADKKQLFNLSELVCSSVKWMISSVSHLPPRVVLRCHQEEL